MAIHPLDVTPENEAEAAAERAEQRRSQSMGVFVWIAWLVGAVGVVLGFLGAVLLSQGAGPNEELGNVLHNLAKLSLLLSFLLLFIGYRMRFHPSREVIEATLLDTDDAGHVRMNDRSRLSGQSHGQSHDQLPMSRPMWTGPTRGQSTADSVRALLDSFPQTVPDHSFANAPRPAHTNASRTAADQVGAARFPELRMTLSRSDFQPSPPTTTPTTASATEPAPAPAAPADSLSATPTSSPTRKEMGP